MAAKSSYSEKLKDPRWQRKRLEILQRDNFTCKRCESTTETLHVHHRYYLPKCEPWGYEPDALVTLCAGCHEYETESRRSAESTLLHRLAMLGFFSGDINALTDSLSDCIHFNGMGVEETTTAIYRLAVPKTAEIK
jgi:hypothetical protein